MTNRVKIIAEAGVNHNGDVSIAERLIDAACLSGADFVKFQLFRAEDLSTPTAPSAEYQQRSLPNIKSQRAMLEELELGFEAHLHLSKYAKLRGIEFLTSAFHWNDLDFVDSINSTFIKIPSGEINNLPYLRQVGRFTKEVIVSTGMSTLEEVEEAIETLVSNGVSRPSITVLQCNSEYPTPFSDVNLLAMRTLRDVLGVKVGISDHTLGTEIAVAAVALGATVVEKHLTLDRSMVGPDHSASLEPEDFRRMVESIRKVEIALGDGIKRPMNSEIQNRQMARKSIVAARDIQEGQLLTADKLTTKRPGTGISPMAWDQIIGRRANRFYSKDEMIEP